MGTFYPPVALNTIQGAAAQLLSYKPLLLIDIAFVDGVTVAHFATDTITYGGHNYTACVTHNTLARMQKLTPLGLDTFPSMSLQLADPAAAIFSQYELLGPGFKGAIVTATLILVDKIHGTVSTDSKVKFVGRADPPSIDDQFLSFNVNSKLNLQFTYVPNVPISKLCPYPFPGTAQQQTEAALINSPFYPCGYLNGGGSLDPTTGAAFTSCNYDKTSCIARGMFSIGRFGGVQWEPSATWANPHIYTSGQKGSGWNTDNQAKYSSYVPLNYGAGMIQGIVANVSGDGNTVRFEVIVGWGDMSDWWDGGINMVIVNNVVVPHNPQDNIFSTPVVANSGFDGTFEWQYINLGSRNGAPNGLHPWDRNGDPYGSMMVIAIVVPTTVHGDSNSVPNVLILTSVGKSIRRYISATTWVNDPADSSTWINPSGGGVTDVDTAGYTDLAQSLSSPIWIIMDLLVTAGPFSYADFDINTAIDAWQVCATSVAYAGVAGSYVFDGIRADVSGTTITTSGTSGGVFATVNVGAGINYTQVRVGQMLQIGADSLLRVNAGVNIIVQSITNPNTLIAVSPGLGTIPVWSSSTPYLLGNFVSSGGVTWQCIQSNINKLPDTNPNYWGRLSLNISHERYRLNLVLQQRQALSDLLTSVKLGCNLNLIVNNQTNLLEFHVDQGLGDQQPSPITGSNDNTAYLSFLATGPDAGNGTGGVVNYQADGRLGTGYVAYSFDETNIILEGNEPNFRSSLTFTQIPAVNTPNRILTPFQNEDIDCESDTSTRVDTDDYQRMQQSYDATVQMEGVPNYDQMFRRANNYMARNFRGNPRSSFTYGDTGGTIIASLKTSGMKVGHLRVGHLVHLSSIKFGLNKQLFRIQSVAATDNFNVVMITMSWHDDRWFLDSYGNGPSPLFSASASALAAATPKGWIPYGGYQIPVLSSADPVYDNNIWLPGAEIVYTLLADGTTQAELRTMGQLPVNNTSIFTQTPWLPSQGTVDVSSGSVPAAHYFVAVVALDGYGVPTLPQSDNNLCRIILAATGSLVVQQIAWKPGTANGAYFVGQHSSLMKFGGYISSQPGTPSMSITAANNVSGTVQCTVTSTSTMANDQVWYISGITGSGFTTGSYAITVVNSTTFALNGLSASGSYTVSSATAAPAIMPTSITISQLPVTANPANPFPAPDNNFDHMQVQVKKIRHAGPVGVAINSLTGTTITVNNAGWATNQWLNYNISVLGIYNSNASIPVYNAHVTGNTSTTLTVSRDPTAFGIVPGSVMIIYSNPTVTIDNAGNTVLTDPNWINSLVPPENPAIVQSMFHQTHPPSGNSDVTTVAPHGFTTGQLITFKMQNPFFLGTATIFSVTGANTFSIPMSSGVYAAWLNSGNCTCYIPTGLDVNAESGQILRVLNSDGTSQTIKIKSNTAISITTDGPPDKPIVTGAITIVEEPDWHYLGQSQASVSLSDPLYVTETDSIISNFAGQTLFVQTPIINPAGQTSPLNMTPYRMLYVYGQNSGIISQANPGYYAITPFSGVATVDFNNASNGIPPGLCQQLTLNAAAVTISMPVWTNGVIRPGMSFSLYLDQDSTGGRAMPTFTGGLQAFASTTAASITLDGTPNTRTSLVFTYHPESIWILDSQSTANALT